MDLMNLGLGGAEGARPGNLNDLVNAPAQGASFENGEGAVGGTLPDAPPWESDEGTPPWEESEEDTDLEIYRKAERFKAIKLLSGNKVDGGVTEQYIRSNYGVRGVQRFKLAKFILDNLGYQASPDVLLTLSCTKKARIVIATAGAGKTTSLQFDLLISKMLDNALKEGALTPMTVEGTGVKLSRILYLNYNKHNVPMIESRHNSVCAAVNKLLKPEDALDPNIESSTVHAFCHKWLRAFAADLELPELAIISEEQKQKIWGAIITPRWKKYYGDADNNIVEYTVLDDLYNYKTESMLDWDSFFLTAKFVDCGLRNDFVKGCLTKYDSMKKQMKLMDFTDYLILMTQTLKDHAELRLKLQDRYRIIIADENQDFTRLMNELLIQLYNPEINQLVVVGDPDQTIYDFKGVSPDNVVTLSETLPDVQLLGLDTNYRCPDVIVDAAKRILNLNILRFEKPINTVRTGGRIFTHPISQAGEQEKQVMVLLRRIGEADWQNTVVTYRNNSSSMIIAEEMYYAGIPFKILDSRRPFNNPVFRHINTALRALLEKDDFQLNCELHRFLPLKKEEWVEILNKNRLQRRNHLHDIIPPEGLPKGCLDALKVLTKISIQIDTQPVCDFIAPLIRLYRTYYFDFMVRQNTYLVTDQENYMMYLERAVKYFSRQMTFEYMRKEMQERNIDNEAGVTLSTFHGLKGLEFNTVIAIDFCESIFPKFFEIDQRYSANTAKEEKESANRLCYVLVTRTIKEFHMFYNAMDPSIYVSLLTKGGNDDGAANAAQEDLAIGSIGSFDASSSKMDFVKRILGGRR